MKQRISNADSYKHLTICPTWLRDFDKFVEDMGECPEGYSLDRKDNKLGYNKDNCRWVTRAAQNRNRQCCIMVGELTLKEFARSVGIPYGTIYHRVKNMGMSPQTAAEYKR